MSDSAGELISRLGVEEGDSVAWILRGMPIAPGSGANIEWLTFSGIYRSSSGSRIVVDTDAGREAISVNDMLRLFVPRKVSGLSLGS